MHTQCPKCCGDHAGPVGHTGFAAFVPPDYGNLHPSLRGLGNGGNYGIFKILSSGELPPLNISPAAAPGMHGYLGKGAVGNNAATSGSRYWSFGLRGMGKGAVGNNAATSGSRYWSFGLRGLGQNQPTAQPSASDDYAKKLNDILAAFRPGADEADAIVKQAQNPLGNNLNAITQQFVTGTNPSVATLQSLYMQVANMWANFKNFVASPQFTDRRASAQALNTLGPIIDGSCGWPSPLPNGPVGPAPSLNCGHWGAGTLGGDGTTGMLGALQRAISGQGGIAPLQSSFLTSGVSGTIGGLPLTTWLLIGLGVLVLSRVGR
jgi:hypothetical protein